MYTRKDYLNGKCSLDDYYSQMVTDGTKQMVTQRIGLKRLLAITDKHLNDIPLKEWDMLALPVSGHAATVLKDAGDYPTLGGAVCIVKTAARMVIKENT